MYDRRIKTKIICTIGPETESFEMQQRMAGAGMNIARLNMSHGDHDWHQRVIKHIRTLNRKIKFPVAIMLDTQGPEIRTGHLASDLDLKKGSVISIVVRGESDPEETSIHIDYDDLIRTVQAGDKITVDSGLINLEVLEKHERMMRCRVLDGGVLKSKRHVNLPGVRVNLPAITKKDRRDIKFGIASDVDYIALSFVREAADILQLKELLGNKVGKIKIIAKIEDEEGVKNVNEIIEQVDGVMVARGDLGVEIDVAETPMVQKHIIRKCQEYSRPVIVATQMLDSMQNSSRPTRAEASDVANAILDGTDACMLSGETAIGGFPVESVKMMNRIMVNTESTLEQSVGSGAPRMAEGVQRVTSAVVFGAARIADRLDAKLVVVATRTGNTARIKAKQRDFIPTLGVSGDPQTLRQLCLFWGIIPVIGMPLDGGVALRTAIEEWGRANGLLETDDYIVFVTSSTYGPLGHDELFVHQIEDTATN